jgi:hypothetical protein
VDTNLGKTRSTWLYVPARKSSVMSHVGEGGAIAEAREMGLERQVGPPQRVATLAADRDDGDVALVLEDLLEGEADRVRVQGAGEAPIGGEDHEEPLAALVAGEERMGLRVEDRGEVGDDLVDLLAVRAGGERRVLGALELRRGDELHRPRDLLDVLDGADAPPDVALAGHVRSWARSA